MSTINLTCHCCGLQLHLQGKGPYKCTRCGANITK